MKLLLLSVLTLASVACAPSTWAQGAKSYGVKLGLSSSEYRFEDFTRPARRGGNAGIFVMAPLGGAFHTLYEAGYHQKGFDESFSQNNSIRYEDGSRYDYVSALIAPQFVNTLGSGQAKLYAFLGPRADVRVRARRTYTGSDGDLITEAIESDDLKRFVLGISGGMGLDLSDVLSIPLLLELRYNGDVTPAFSREERDETLTARHRTFDFRIGFSF